MLTTRTFKVRILIYQRVVSKQIIPMELFVPHNITVEVGDPDRDWKILALDNETATYLRVSVPIDGKIINGWIDTRDLAVDVLLKVVKGLADKNPIDLAILAKSDTKQALNLYNKLIKETQAVPDALVIYQRLQEHLGKNT